MKKLLVWVKTQHDGKTKLEIPVIHKTIVRYPDDILPSTFAFGCVFYHDAFEGVWDIMDWGHEVISEEN